MKINYIYKKLILNDEIEKKIIKGPKKISKSTMLTFETYDSDHEVLFNFINNKNTKKNSQ